MGESSAFFGKTSPGSLKDETGFLGAPRGFDASSSYAVNSVQAVMIKQFMTTTPQGNWALTANCTDWAVGAALSGGIYIPRSSYSSFGFADPAALRNFYSGN